MEDPAAREESVGELFGRLADDGKSFARAELGYYRALATAKLSEAAVGLGLGAAGLLLALAALFALPIGLILALATLVGPGWATLIVVIAFLALAGLLGWLAYRQLQRVFGSKP